MDLNSGVGSDGPVDPFAHPNEFMPGEDAFDVSFQQISLGYLVLISGDLVISYGFWAKRERFMRDSIPRHQANSLRLFRF